MKRFALAVLLFAFTAGATTPTVNLDPSPGTYLGQRAKVTNTRATSVAIAGNSGILLQAAVTLAAGDTLDLVWDGAHWVPTGTLATFSNFQNSSAVFDGGVTANSFGIRPNVADGGSAELAPVMALDRGTAVQQLVQFDSASFASGFKSVTFPTPFATAVSTDGGRAIHCLCTTASGSDGGCAHELPTTTACTFYGPGSNTFDWFCSGPRIP